MKKIALCLIVAFTAMASMSAQDLKQKAAAELEKMVGEWTYTMENPMDASTMEGVLKFVKDDNGIMCLLNNTMAGDLKSGYFVPGEDGRNKAVMPVVDYNMDMDVYVSFNEEGGIVLHMDVAGMMEMDAVATRKAEEN